MKVTIKSNDKHYTKSSYRQPKAKRSNLRSKQGEIKL